MVNENNYAKWFCDFDLIDTVPDHSVLCRFRKLVGTNRLSKIFNNLKNQLKSKGYMNEVFTFIDASYLISKASL